MKIKQRKEKIPFVIFWFGIGGALILLGFFASDSTWEDEFPRSKALFFGAWTIGFAILWFFFGSIDLSQWNAIRSRFGKGKAEPPPNQENESNE